MGILVGLHPRPDEEFAGQVAYYDERETGLGRRLYDEVIAQSDWIARNPEVPRLRKGYGSNIWNGLTPALSFRLTLPRGLRGTRVQDRAALMIDFGLKRILSRQAKRPSKCNAFPFASSMI